MYSVVMFRDSLSGPKRFREREVKTLSGAERVAKQMLAQNPIGSEITDEIRRFRITHVSIANLETGEGTRYA